MADRPSEYTTASTAAEAATFLLQFASRFRDLENHMHRLHRLGAKDSTFAPLLPDVKKFFDATQDFEEAGSRFACSLSRENNENEDALGHYVFFAAMNGDAERERWRGRVIRVNQITPQKGNANGNR